MNLQQSDLIVVVAYLVAVYVLAIKAWRKLHKIRSTSPSYISAQYLAGHDISTFQATCSLVAAEVSAITFFSVPVMVFSLNFSTLQFAIGAMVGRLFTSFISIEHIYGKGITFFEILTQLIPRSENKKGRQILAFFYVAFKLGGIGIKLFTGAMLVGQFFDLTLFDSITIVMILTFIYTVIGGLKAVVYTDVMQLFVLLFGVILAHYEFTNLTGKPWSLLMVEGLNAGKLSFFSPDQSYLSVLSALFVGLVSGFFLPVTDQESLQKLLGTRSKQMAQKALRYSAVLAIVVRLMVLTLGVLIWSHYQSNPIPNVPITRLFDYYVLNFFPSPLKGFIVASILAATMSTLDSGLNAISACFWNDIVSHTEVQNFRVYVNTDNFIIAMLITMVAYSGTKSEFFVKLFMAMGEYITPVLATLFLWAVMTKKFLPISMGRFNSFLLLGSCMSGAFIAGMNQIGEWKIPIGLFLGIFGLKLSIKIGQLITKK